MNRSHYEESQWTSPHRCSSDHVGDTFVEPAPDRQIEPDSFLTARGLAVAVFIVFVAVIASHYFPLGFGLELP